ncbi:MAG: PilZ domain-containing protein [Candidatus Electrothrix sp. GW3-4]|uniref:PilZ domain-containing protein n=1 Tax=Candidatus Electrothrix sp. GW3-4 TaxID=3126740 RepID=UPI0030D17F65
MVYDNKFRKQDRVKLRGYIADISDGTYEYDAIVEDVSLEGLCLTDLSNKFVVEKKIYTVVIAGGPDADSFKLQAQPRWLRRHGDFVEVGFTIIRSPTKWKKFLRELIPKKGAVSLEEEWERCSNLSIW